MFSAVLGGLLPRHRHGETRTIRRPRTKGLRSQYRDRHRTIIVCAADGSGSVKKPRSIGVRLPAGFVLPNERSFAPLCHVQKL